MFMKRIASLVISLTMIVSLSSNIALAVDTKIAEANGAGESQAVLTQQPTLMNVRVPTQLPVDIDKDGNVAVATDSSIVNNGVGPISVKSVTVKPLGAWQLAEYTKDFKSEKVGLKEFGMILNSDLVQTDGSLTLTPASWVNVAGGRVLPITYNANVATQKDLINETIANVVFVIGWATNGEIPSKSEIHSLRVQSAPTSVVYNVGDAIDLTGLSLYAVYLDGTSREITNYRVLNGSRLTANQKSVDIEYMDSGKLVTTSINITVNNPVTSISITKSPSKVAYIAGETFDTTGMEITATYTNGDTAVISGYTVEDGAALSIEKSLVTISYIDNGKTVKVTQPITVTNPLVSIAVTKTPSKTTYTVGENFETVGLEVTATYTNGSTAVVSGYSILDGAGLPEGKTSITISYTEDGKVTTTTQPINISNPLVSIAVTKAPYKVNYIAGESFAVGGLEITATYTNGRKAVVTDYTVTDGTSLIKGKSSVTISYTENGKVATTVQVISVTNPLVSIAVTKAPSKTMYTVGENFEAAGMEVTATYTNGLKGIKTGYSILDGAGLSEGRTSVTISYTEDGKTVTTTQPINISNPLVSITVTKAPSKVNYLVGENFSTGGLEVTATYTNGRKAVVTSYTITDGTSLIKGKSSVTISYTENDKVATAVQVISVTNPVESIAVTKAPSKVKYIEGESFSATGLEVTATYANGQKAVITSYSIQNKENLQLDRKSVTITYTEEGKTVTTLQPITVVRPDLVSIVIKTPPTKVEYEIGESFNSAGMKIQANYSNGTNKIVPNFVVSNGTNLSKGNNSIKISYTEGSITKDVYQSVVADKFKTTFRFSNGSTQMVDVIGEVDQSSYTVPSGAKLTSVDIGKHVTIIGNHAFIDCNLLNSVSIPSSVTTIGFSAFDGCDSLASVSIPSSVTTIDHYAFYNCNSLASVSIPYGVTTIGDSAFYNCNSLASVSIPSSVTTIGDSAFYNCSSLTSVSIPSSVTTISDSAFYNCNSLASVSIPSSVTTISTHAFAYCASLTSVSIPKSVTTIDKDAFYKCTSLTSVSIPSSVTTIGWGTFDNCTSLASVSIPSSVTTIGHYAFYNCKSLNSVSIPSSVTTIGKYAFYNCNSLASVSIPSSVTTIGDYAFNQVPHIQYYGNASGQPWGANSMN